MTQDQIRKLLGGYATNALTAEERRVLFEAALEDQELFNALQNEDALRELLDDPVSREQVRAALQTHRPRISWRRWTFGVAVPAVAAVILIAVMNRAISPRAAVQIAHAPPPPPPIRETQPAPPPPVVEQRTRKQSARSIGALAQATASATAQLKPAPGAAAPLPRPALDAPSMTNFSAATRLPVVPAAVRQKFSAGLETSAALYQGPLVRYSLLRSGPRGNSVRVEVTIGIAGYLALYELDAAGKSTEVYPTNNVATRVLPNQAIQIPANPIGIPDGSRLRLVVVPAPPQAVNGFLAGGDTTIGTGTPPLAPLVVDIPLVP
jgi:hypothetical protein